MAQIVELTIGESPTTRYIVEYTLEDGRLILRPETDVDRMHADLDSRPLTADEFDALIAPHIGPPDGEG